jgi:preprotein translocase subunit SecF
MEFFKIRKDIPFMRHALVLQRDFVPDLRRCGVLPVHARAAPVGRVHRRHGDGGGYSQPADVGQGAWPVSGLGYGDVQVQNFGTSRDVMIRLPAQKGVTNSAQQSEKVLWRRVKADARNSQTCAHRIRGPAGRRRTGA